MSPIGLFCTSTNLSSTISSSTLLEYLWVKHIRGQERWLKSLGREGHSAGSAGHVLASTQKVNWQWLKLNEGQLRHLKKEHTPNGLGKLIPLLSLNPLILCHYSVPSGSVISGMSPSSYLLPLTNHKTTMDATLCVLQSSVPATKMA